MYNFGSKPIQPMYVLVGHEVQGCTASSFQEAVEGCKLLIDQLKIKEIVSDGFPFVSHIAVVLFVEGYLDRLTILIHDSPKRDEAIEKFNIATGRDVRGPLLDPKQLNCPADIEAAVQKGADVKVKEGFFDLVFTMVELAKGAILDPTCVSREKVELASRFGDHLAISIPNTRRFLMQMSCLSCQDPSRKDVGKLVGSKSIKNVSFQRHILGRQDQKSKRWQMILRACERS